MATRRFFAANSTNVERSGTGQTRPGCSVEKAGTGGRREDGQIEKAGTGIVRQGLLALSALCLLSTPTLASTWQLKLSEQNGQMALLAHGADLVIVGGGVGMGDHHVFPVFAIPVIDSEGAGTGGIDSEGAGTGGPDSEGAGTGGIDSEGAGTGGPDSEGAGTGGIDSEGAGTGGIDSEGAGTGGPDSEGAGTGGIESEGAGTGGEPAVWGYAEASRAADGSWTLSLFKSEAQGFSEVLAVSGLGD